MFVEVSKQESIYFLKPLDLHFLKERLLLRVLKNIIFKNLINSGTTNVDLLFPKCQTKISTVV